MDPERLQELLEIEPRTPSIKNKQTCLTQRHRTLQNCIPELLHLRITCAFFAAIVAMHEWSITIFLFLLIHFQVLIYHLLFVYNCMSAYYFIHSTNLFSPIQKFIFYLNFFFVNQFSSTVTLYCATCVTVIYVWLYKMHCKIQTRVYRLDFAYVKKIQIFPFKKIIIYLIYIPFAISCTV